MTISSQKSFSLRDSELYSILLFHYTFNPPTTTPIPSDNPPLSISYNYSEWEESCSDLNEVYPKNQFSIDNRQLITYLKDSLTSEQAPSFCDDVIMGEIRQFSHNGGGDIIGVLCMIF